MGVLVVSRGAGVVLEIDSTTVQVRDFPSPQMLAPRPASQMCEVGAQMLSNCHHPQPPKHNGVKSILMLRF